MTETSAAEPRAPEESGSLGGGVTGEGEDVGN